MDPSSAPSVARVDQDARGEELFGGLLSSLLQRADTADGIPHVVSVLMDRLRDNDFEGMRSEGIFRVPGDSNEMKEFRRLVNQGGNIEQLAAKCQDLNSIAGLLKMFFRELRPPLLTFTLYGDFVRCSSRLGAPNDSQNLAGLCSLLQQLPPGCANLL